MTEVVTTQEPPLGMVDMTNEEYHASAGVSKSHLDCIAGKSPLHYWHRYVNPQRQPDEPTPAKILGTAIHSIILEPDLFSANYVQVPEGTERRSNAGKADWEMFKYENQGKIILSREDYAHCLQVRDAVYRHPTARQILKGGRAEQTFIARDPETGELIKCRFDYLYEGGSVALDLKSTEDASPAGFAKSIANYRYDLQPPWYFDVLHALYGERPQHWVFIAVEKEPLYAIGFYTISAADMEIARQAARRDFLRIVEYKRQNYWPDYGMDLQEIELPGWMKR